MSERPHVVWITLDSVRADHTTMAGYHRDTTPKIDSLAESGQYLSNCFAHGKYTLTSTAAILTGTVPEYNRVGYERSTLPTDVRTVAERFGAAGYRTGGFSSNRYVSGETGLARGFDHFGWIHPSTLLGTVPLSAIVKYALNIRRHSAGFQLDKYKHATPYLVNETSKHWLSDYGDDPLFLYLHYNEPHRPYYPPLGYLDRYTEDIAFGPAEAGDFSMEAHQNLERFIAAGRDLSPEELDALRAMYDAEITYTDELVGKLVEYVRALDDRDVIFIVTADHGELFGEYDLLGHKLVLHDELTHVPMVVSGLPDFDSDQLVQHNDVMKTILGYVGADADDVQGINLREDVREYVVSQHHETNWQPFLEHDPDFDTDPFHSGDFSAIRTADYRFQMGEDGEELFDVADETTDVLDSWPGIAADLRQELESWLKSHRGAFASDDEDYSERMRNHLADMGYVE